LNYRNFIALKANYSKHIFDTFNVEEHQQNIILKPASKLIGISYSFAGAILFSTKAVLVKLAYQHDVDATSLLMLRMLFALPFFIGLLIYFKGITKQGIDRLSSYKWRIIILGLCGYYLASYLDLLGLEFIDASLERIIIFIYPTFVILLSYYFLKQSTTFNQILAIVISYIGIVIAFYGNLSINPSPQLYSGAVLVIGSAFFYSIYLVGSQSTLAKMNSRIYNAAAMITACLVILIHNSILNGFNVFDFSIEVYLYAILLALFATVIPSFLIVEGIKIIGANNSSIIGTIGPVSTIILATLLLGEHLNATQLFGSAVVILGVLYLILYRNKKQKKAPSQM